MAKDDWVRLIMHLPWGVMAVALCIPSMALGITAFVGSLSYEAFNDWRKHDESYKDVLGIVWGFFIGGFAFWLLGFYSR